MTGLGLNVYGGVHGLDPSQLHVVTAITNPVRFRSRYALYRDFAKRMEDAGVTFWTIEAAFGQRDHGVTTDDDFRHIQLRTTEELWHKENLLNLAIQRMPADAQYIAWVDADVQFTRADWAIETLHRLQQYDFVQMFSHAMDVGPNYEPIQSHLGFAYSYVHQLFSGQASDYCAQGHPGYAWAARRRSLDAVGGLIDWAILGSGDKHMAMGLIGKITESRPNGLSRGYIDELVEWEARAERHIKRNLGYVDGTINHFWHGRKKDRKYRDRWEILRDHQYDPRTDIKYDSQGIVALNDSEVRQLSLRDAIRAYFASRNEDTIEV